MRTNIAIDDKLMSEAIKLTGVKTKKDAVELALKEYRKCSDSGAVYDDPRVAA